MQNGIYAACGASLALLLIRIARPRGSFLGKVRVRHRESDMRDVFVPMKSTDGVLNPHLEVDPPAPGVIIYRFEESFLYPNVSLVNRAIADYVREHTRRGQHAADTAVGDRPWNDPGPAKGAADPAEDQGRPLLRAIVFDFSGVSTIDTTGVQALVDTRSEVERWVGGPVEFHFATLLSPWIRRALVAGGFGTGDSRLSDLAEIAGIVPYHGGHADPQNQERPTRLGEDVENKGVTSEPRFGGNNRARGSFDTLVPLDTP